MQFLKTLFWVIVAVAVVLFASSNWDKIVSVNLWADLQADVKLPVFGIGAFLLGFLPTFLILRARIWSLTRRIEAQGQSHVANTPAAPIRNAPAPPEMEPRANI